MNALVNFFERHGVTMEWRFGRAFLAWFLTPVFVLGLVILTLLLANPQSSRWVYIFQAMATQRGGPHPWGDEGPRPPANYSGVWCRWHWNGRLSFEEHYKNGKLDGPFRAWAPSGNLWLDTGFKNGKYDGKYLLFFDTGALRRQEEFSEGTPIGHWVSFYEDGTKSYEASFSKPGVLDGEQILWEKGGKVTRWVWREGEPWDGRFTLEKGTNWFKETYKSGTLLASTNLGPFLAQYGFAASPSGPVKK